VFSGVVFMSDTMVKSMGFGLAVAVVFDAFVVRMCLIPALLYLLMTRPGGRPSGSTASCPMSTSRETTCTVHTRRTPTPTPMTGN
jgi:hypothetical protein